MSPDGEKALSGLVPASPFSAYVVSSDIVGLWILTEASVRQESQGPWPSLFVKWQLIDALRAVYASGAVEERRGIGFHSQS
jgi:hypothetical protein